MRTESGGKLMLDIKYHLLVVLFTILLALPIVYGDAAIVYDNSTTPTQSIDPGWIPEGYLAFSRYDPYEQTGDEITLAGTEREIVQFDMILSSIEPTTLSNLTLIFRELESTEQGHPEVGPVIWTDSRNNIDVDGLTTVSFSVPNIVVPDNFIWLASSDSMVSGLASFDPPTIGSSQNQFWDYSVPLDTWYSMNFDNDPVANFGATVWAVPEPTTLGMLFLSGLVLSVRKNKANCRETQ
jgi:hypothetical protein